MAVVCAVLAYPTQCVWPMPSAPSAYRESTAVMSCTVSCQCVVCGWCMSVCGVRVVGYPLSAPPYSWWWGWLSWMVGWHCVVGWHGDGRAGAVMVTLPFDIGVPRLVCLVALVEWRGVVCAVLPRVRVGSGILLCPAPLLHHPTLRRLLSYLCLFGAVFLCLGLCLCVWAVGGGRVVHCCFVFPVLLLFFLFLFVCWCSG